MSNRKIYANNLCTGKDYAMCSYYPAIPATEQQEFYDRRICVKRGGQQFVVANRPEANGKCFPGYEPCSQKTDIEHTICYDTKTTTFDEACPITDFVFYKNGTGTYATDKAWTVIPFDKDVNIAYTKTASGNLPLMSAKLEYQPCMLANQRSVSPNQKFWQFEHAHGDCEVDEMSKLKYDPRYQEAGLVTNLYEVQDESNVWDRLKKLPGFDTDLEKKQRKETEIKFWVRPTISWSTECELKGMQRLDVYKELTEPVAAPFVLLIAAGLMVLSCCVECCAQITARNTYDEARA